MTKLLEPIHPGEILREEFLKPLAISIDRLARDIVVPPGRISEIVNGKRGITADTALRLTRYFDVSAELCLGYKLSMTCVKPDKSPGKKLRRAFSLMQRESGKRLRPLQT